MLLREWNVVEPHPAAFISAVVWRQGKGAVGSFPASEWPSNLRQDTNLLGHLPGSRLVYDSAGRDDCKKVMKKVWRAIILNSALVMMSFKQKVMLNIGQWTPLDQEQHRATSQNAEELLQQEKLHRVIKSLWKVQSMQAHDGNGILE